MNTILRRTTLITALALSTYGWAQAYTPPGGLPAVQHFGDVSYLSGGIGVSETRAIEQARVHWPVSMEFAVLGGPHAAFAADVGVTVRDAQGKLALQTTSQGPFLLAHLAPGRYKVTAQLDGRVLHRDLSVVQGHSDRLLFEWPRGTDEGHVS